jgi:hypothetical protein
MLIREQAQQTQLLDHLPSYEFQKRVARYRGDANHRGFSCRDQYLAMAFAQLTCRESLRDIVLKTAGSATAYPDALRRVSYFDAAIGKRLVFLTNNFTLPALTIADIYKQR